MAELHKLKNSQVRAANQVGLLSDGGGLYLQVSKAGNKSWIYRFKLFGKRRDMGLGRFQDIGLADAREVAAEARKLVAKGIDPIEDRKAEQQAIIKAAKGQTTFRECAEKFIATHEPGWKHPKHTEQWKNSLENHVYPIIGEMPVKQVNVEAVQRVLTPIWNTKTETATRVRGRIERILDWAQVNGYREGANPAYWRGNLEHIYTKPSKIMNIRHMPSLPYENMSSYMQALRKQGSLTANAIELMIYTVTRPTEALSAKWEEFDFNSGIWTIPKTKMKGGVAHEIPLSRQCLELLEQIPRFDNSDFLFPSMKKGQHISNSAMLKFVKNVGNEIGFPDITGHGFRASFKTWTSETQNFDWQAVEFCLAHKIKDKAAAAYHRTNLLEKRRVIMSAWANYCFDITQLNVISLKI